MAVRDDVHAGLYPASASFTTFNNPLSKADHPILERSQFFIMPPLSLPQSATGSEDSHDTYAKFPQ